MLPGPDEIYRCPNCDNLLRRGALLSANTFGSIKYSDGRIEAKGFPALPSLTKCSKCNTIFWLDKLEVIAEYNCWDGEVNETWDKAESVQFLDISEYERALNDNIYNDVNEEFFIRERIWYRFNIRGINNQSLFQNSDFEIIWRNNILRLIELLDINDEKQKIKIAELNRNLGNFQLCKDIWNTIENPELEWLKKQVIAECDKNNSKTFKVML